MSEQIIRNKGEGTMMDDLISRQAAIKAICEDGTWLESQGCTEITMAERKQRDADILSDLPSAQPDRGYIEQIKWERDLAIRQLADLGYGLGEKPRTNGDLISRQAAMDALIKWYGCEPSDIGAFENIIEKLPSAQPERFTDEEQRIFLSAMAKEEKVCKHVDDVYKDSDEDSLVRICHEITRKVKGVLWT